MGQSFPLARPLPPSSEPAVAIVRALRAAGHEALLAGGCVRDLLLGIEPDDYDVATDADPDRVCGLFRSTRRVGAAFGVVLVRQHGRWVEVATFRTDGSYRDGRRPESVRFSTAEDDARRRDFTINGMFLDPLADEVRDYVGGYADLHRRLLRCIGRPADRFAEDYLRLLRAVRIAARLDFTIEPATRAAMSAAAASVAGVAMERVRDELERMLAHPSRSAAVELLCTTGLLGHLCPEATSRPDALALARQWIARLPADAGFVTSLAALLHPLPAREVERVARRLTLSNEERDAVTWLVAHQADLNDSATIGLPALKKLLAHPAFPALVALFEARGPGDARIAALRARIAAIDPRQIQPSPLVTGEDLMARGVAAGPIYKRILAAVYDEQLAETLRTREQALARLDQLLAAERGR